MTRFVAIVGAKGGVGKTTIAINLGSALTEFGREIIIVDANISKPNVGLNLGLTNTPKSVHTAIAGEHKLDEAIFYHPSGIRVVPCHMSIDYLKHAKHNSILKDILLDLTDKAELVLVDTAPGFGDETTEIIKATGEIILVTTPDLTAVTDCLKSARLAKELGAKVIGVVATKVNESDYEITLENIETILETPVIGVIPYDTNLLEAQHNKYPVVYTHKNSHSSIGFKKLAANIIGEEYIPDVESNDGIVDYILKRTGVKDEVNKK
jgi:septum site-determining protein MinD